MTTSSPDTSGEWRPAKVRVAPELMAEWTQWRTLNGDLVTCSWGEPDADGYYDPQFTRHTDDNPLDAATKRAEKAEAALRDGAIPALAFMVTLTEARGMDGTAESLRRDLAKLCAVLAEGDRP